MYYKPHMKTYFSSFASFRIGYYSIVSLQRSVIYFGGETYIEESFGSLNIVAEFQNDSWRKLGKMTKARSFHKSIPINGKIFIVGGAGSKLSLYRLTEIYKMFF